MTLHFKEQGFYLTSIHILTFALNIKSFVAHLLLEKKNVHKSSWQNKISHDKIQNPRIKKRFSPFLGVKEGSDQTDTTDNG